MRREVGLRGAVIVSALPMASAALVGVTVTLSSNGHPFWCDGTQWIDLSVAGADKKIQYNNAGAAAGAGNVEIDNEDLNLVVGATLVTPAADRVKLFASRVGAAGGRVLLGMIDRDGVATSLAPAEWRSKIGRWNPAGNSTTVPGVDGFNAPTALGTATARTVSSSSTLRRARRLGYVSSTTAASLAGHYSTAAQVSLGNGSGVGGFFYSARFGISDAALVSVARTFVGLSSSVAEPTNVEPNTLTNCIGVGHIGSAANLQLFYGGSAAQTLIDLGTNFPVSATYELYELTLSSPAAESSVVYYTVERIGTPYKVSGKLGPGTQGLTLPGSGTLLAHRAWRSNNTSTSAVGIDISSIYLETNW